MIGSLSRQSNPTSPVNNPRASPVTTLRAGSPAAFVAMSSPSPSPSPSPTQQPGPLPVAPSPQEQARADAYKLKLEKAYAELGKAKETAAKLPPPTATPPVARASSASAAKSSENKAQFISGPSGAAKRRGSGFRRDRR